MNPQQQAIDKLNGPCLVRAGAGTGKTWTIVQKVVRLVNTNVCKPSDILCLTFSNETTNNLSQKISEELKMSSGVTVKTFHGFCALILKEFGHLINVAPDFTILLPDNAKVIMHMDLEIDPYKADLYVKSISTAKDIGISLDQIESHIANFKTRFSGNITDLDAYANDLDVELRLLHLRPQDTKEQKKEVKDRKNFIKQFVKDYAYYTKYVEFIDAWKKYDELKRSKKYLDYSDLNFLALKLFDTYGADDVSKKYKYVIVDEFQDTNKLQFDLICHLAQGHRNITVVGDPNQSIYGFRGSFRGSFDEFKVAFDVKDEEIFTLDKSRRSPNTVLRTARTLIKNNYPNPDDCMHIEHFENVEGAKVSVIELKNGAEESRKVAEIVEKEIEDGTALKEICVLHRTHAQGKLIREALESKNIPIITAGKTDLMQKAEVRTAIAYLSILNNLQKRTGTGEQAWWELFHYHNALTPEDAIKIGRYLKKNRKEESIDYAVILKIEHLDISDAGKNIIKRIIEKLKEIMKQSNKPLPELILDVYELTGLNRAFSHSRNARNIEGLMNLKCFYDVAVNFHQMHGIGLEEFIDYLEILEKIGVEVEASKITDVNAVRLMTIHAVKGLEFEKVIVTNLSDKRFPLERTPNEPLIPKELNPDIKLYLEKNQLNSEDTDEIKDYEKKTLLEEERRLCYVAFTRASKNLTITYTKSYNDNEDSTKESDFLIEINHKANPDIEFIQDTEEKSTIFAPNSKFEQYKGLLKNQLVESLDTDDIKVLLSRLITYHAVREGEIVKYDVDLNKLVDKEELENHIINHHQKKSGLKFDKTNFTFSPTAIIEYNECPKRYELKHIFQMPGRGDFAWSGASTGSFVHKVLQNGVKELYTTKEQFIEQAQKLSTEDEWQGVDLTDVNNLIDVFWIRNNGKYNEKTLTEKWLDIELDGFKFGGIADRIDYINETDVEIIDYKTDKSDIKPKKRALQLGFYALAAKDRLGVNVKKLTLEMLRLEKPLEGTVNDDEVTAGRSEGFKISEVKKELVNTAKAIMHDYENEFIPKKEDEPCRYCGHKFYCSKWSEK